MRNGIWLALLGCGAIALATPARADLFSFSTGNPDGRIGLFAVRDRIRQCGTVCE